MNKHLKIKRKIKFTEQEDLMYSKLMGTYLNLGNSNLQAEKLTLEEMKEIYPRLKKLLNKNVKISLEVSK